MRRLLLALLLFAAPLAAQQPATVKEGDLIEGSHVVAVSPISIAVCYKSASSRRAAQGCGPDATGYTEMRARILEASRMIDDAVLWLRTAGYDTSKNRILTYQGRLVYSFGPRLAVCNGVSKACVAPQPFASKHILGVPLESITATHPALRFDRATAAHEFFHTLQKIPVKRRGSQTQTWFFESTAEAVGLAFAGKDGLYDTENKVSFDLSFGTWQETELNDATETEGYEQAAFWIWAGQELGSKNKIGYLKPTLAHPASSEEGYRFADSPHLRDARLRYGLPDFVAALNGIHDYKVKAFIEAGAKVARKPAYFERIDKGALTLKADGTGEPQSLKFSVRQSAAEAALLTLTIPPNDTAHSSEDLAWLSFYVDDRETLKDHLVVEHENIAQRQALYLVPAKGTLPEPLFVRAVNTRRVTDKSWSKITVNVKADPLEIVSPYCLRPGQPFEVLPEPWYDITPNAKQKMYNWELSTDNGTVNDGFVTPARTGSITLTLALYDPVTRQTGTLVPQRRQIGTATLGPFIVNPHGCDIRLHFPESEAYATYTADGRYTEIVDPTDGTRVYISDIDIAIWAPGEGWMNIPANIRAEFAKSYVEAYAEMMALPEEDRAEQEEADHIDRHLPLSLAWTFADENMSRAIGTLNAARSTRSKEGKIIRKALPKKSKPPEWGGSALKMKDAPCPQANGGSGCQRGALRIAGYTIATVTRDSYGRAVEVDFQGNPFRLSYGKYSVGKPPGW